MKPEGGIVATDNQRRIVNSVLERTESICPFCKKIIPAEIIEENSSVFMVKQCAEHGSFKAILSKYSWYYRGLNQLYDILFPDGHPLSHRTIRSVQFYPTTRCNLQCPLCYSYDNETNKEFSLKEIEQMIRAIRGKKVISILGGEPTVRADIFEIIKLFRSAGHIVELYTNGIKLKDVNYVKNLKHSGVAIVQLGVDSLSDDKIYESMRGTSLLLDKKGALANLRDLNVNTGIIDVLVRGVSEPYLDDILTFCRRNYFIKEVSLRGYSYLGRLGFSPEQEFTVDELVEVVEKHTKGLVTLEEFYLFQQITHILRFILFNTPQCYVSQHIFVPRKGKRMRDIFPYSRFMEYIRIFKEMVQESPGRAKMYFLRKVAARISFSSPALLLQRLVSNRVRFFESRYYLPLEITTFYTPYTIDLKKVKKRCCDVWLPSYAQGTFEDYCGYLARTSPSLPAVGFSGKASPAHHSARFHRSTDNVREI